jgi:ferredoxin
MNFTVTKHQFSQLINLIQQEYRIFGTIKIEDKYILQELDGFEPLIPAPKSVLSFKEILWPKIVPLEMEAPKKIAFVNLTNCDAVALFKLIAQLKDVIKIDRKDLIIITSECISTESCFCTIFDDYKIEHSDLHLQKNKSGGYTIFAFSEIGKNYLKKIEIKPSKEMVEITKPNLEDKSRINKKLLFSKMEEKQNSAEFWQRIADNCFGCGSCSAVCPLCFCTRQVYKNEPNGDCTKYLEKDSCFSKTFSEIQHHFDLRPTRKDRLYNWYHHKFGRSYFDNREFLCTGCGRCIDACPAHLNQKNIIKNIVKKDE